MVKRSPQLKPPLKADQMQQVHLLSRIRHKQIISLAEIDQNVTGTIQEIAIQLLEAIQEDDLEGFNRVYEALSVDHPYLKEWRGLVETPAPPENKPKERTYQLHPLSYLTQRPKREWGVDHIVLDRGSSLFFGDGASGKSTFVLDMYLSRACGIRFLDKTVKEAFVIWVAAESVDDLYPRANAMLKCNNIPVESLTNFLVLDGRVPFNNTAEVALFIEEVKEQLEEMRITPQTHSLAFVFDTYARCTPGSDENSTQETKIIADTILSVGEAFNAHVTVIHHVNAQGRIRGNTALRDAIDTAWHVTKEGSRMRLHCNKMRGDLDPDDLHVEMRSIILDENNLEETAPVIFSTSAPTDGSFTSNTLTQMLKVLYVHGQLTSNQWQKYCVEVHSITKSTFHNYLPMAVNEGLVNKPEGTKKGQRVYYTLTEKGSNLLE